MTRSNFCEHMFACPRGPCDMPPCDKCGALCPNSTWEPADAMREFDQAMDDLMRTEQRLSDRVQKYGEWLKRQEVDA